MTARNPKTREVDMRLCGDDGMSEEQKENMQEKWKL